MVEKLTAKKEKWGFLKGAAGAKLARLAGPWSNWVKADGLKQCPKGKLSSVWQNSLTATTNSRNLQAHFSGATGSSASAKMKRWRRLLM